MIEGVKIRQLRRIPDERGYLMEIFRSDWEEFKKFGQVYMTVAFPGVVKAWHFHEKQTDHFAVIKGMAKIVLFDDRKDSKTKGEVNEFFAGTLNPILLTIPPKVMHGFKAIGNKEAIVVNAPDQLYNYEKPDEFRVPFDSKKIPYNWELKMK